MRPGPPKCAWILASESHQPLIINGQWTWTEDVFPIEDGDILFCYVSLPEGYCIYFYLLAILINFAYNLLTHIITWNRCNGNRITVEAIEILFERHSGRLSSQMLVPVKRNGRRQSSVLCQRMCAELSPPRLLLPATNSWPLLTLEDIQTLARKRLEKLICN